MSNHPEAIAYRIDLARTCLEQGHLCHTGKNRNEARQHSSRAIDLLEPFHRRLPKEPTVQASLVIAHRYRALALQGLALHLEPVPDWDRAIQLSASAQRPALIVQRAYALARGGDHVRARSAAEALPRLEGPTASLLYDAACLRALCSGVVATDLSLPEPEREWRQEAHALRALAFLARARAAGFFTTAARVKLLQEDSDIEALRDRGDFQNFLTAVRAKAKPPAAPEAKK